MPSQARIEADGAVHDVTVTRSKDTGSWRIEVDGVAFEVRRQANGHGDAFLVDGTAHHVRLPTSSGPATVDGAPLPFRVLAVSGGAAALGATSGATVKVKPPMIGRLESLRVKLGDVVAKGQVLFVLEAMKMHNEVKAPAAGKVTALHATAGAALDVGQVIVEIGPA